VVGGTSTLLVRLIMLALGVVVLIVALGILFVVLDANTSNTIVSHVRDWAKTLAGPFDGIFSLSSHKGSIALNWGLAIVVYAVVARLITAPLRGASWWGRRATAAAP